MEIYNEKKDIDTKGGQIYILLDTIKEGKNEKLFPFYYNLLNILCEISDDNITEILGTRCIDLLLTRTDYILHRFKTSPKGYYVKHLFHHVLFLHCLNDLPYHSKTIQKHQ